MYSHFVFTIKKSGCCFTLAFVATYEWSQVHSLEWKWYDYELVFEINRYTYLAAGFPGMGLKYTFWLELFHKFSVMWWFILSFIRNDYDTSRNDILRIIWFMYQCKRRWSMVKQSSCIRSDVIDINVLSRVAN